MGGLFENLHPRAIAIVVDPIQSMKGLVNASPSLPTAMQRKERRRDSLSNKVRHTPFIYFSNKEIRCVFLHNA